MKKTQINFIICLIIICLAVMTGCSGAGTSSGSKGKVEVAESAYFVDKDTGEYSFVVIIENNSDSPIIEGFCSETGYDKDGKQMNGKAMHVAAPFVCLDKGEKEAYVYSTADNQGESILGHYESLPDTLEWEVTQATANPDLTPLGISVEECVTTGDYGDWAEYEITLSNASDKDYVYDIQRMYYQTDAADIDIKVAAVYRDDAGNIKDVVLMVPRPVSQKDLLANSEASMEFYSNYVCTDKDLTPEYYLCIDRYELH